MQYIQILHVFAVGLAVLAGAIIINWLAGLLGISTWYTFLSSVSKNGLLKALVGNSIISNLFLFILYPLLLGMIGYFTTKIFL